MTSGPGGVPWAVLIGRADRTALLELVSEHLPQLSEREVLRCLAHPHADEQVIGLVLGSRAHLSVRAVRKALALHPRTPRPDALRCLEELPWRDLADVAREVRVPGPVRRAANRRLLELLPRLSRGEKTALARRADRDLFPALLDGTPPDVLDALLENPRLAEEDLTAWLLARNPAPPLVERLAGSPRWSDRGPIRSALLFCRRTPRAVLLGLLPRASRDELERLAADPEADPLVAACAERVLSGRDGGNVDRGARGN